MCDCLCEIIYIHIEYKHQNNRWNYQPEKHQFWWKFLEIIFQGQLQMACRLTTNRFHHSSLSQDHGSQSESLWNIITSQCPLDCSHNFWCSYVFMTFHDCHGWQIPLQLQTAQLVQALGSAMNRLIFPFWLTITCSPGALRRLDTTWKLIGKMEADGRAFKKSVSSRAVG